MNKFTRIIPVLLAIFVLASCNNALPGDNPPTVFIEENGRQHDAVLGSYCWNNICADAFETIKLWGDRKPIQIQSGDQITVDMNFTPKPNQAYLIQILDDETEINIPENPFTAPHEKGVYYYLYSVWWEDEQRENYSLGDAYYVFAIEVK